MKAYGETSASTMCNYRPRSHPADLLLALVLVKGRGAEVAPPLKQHGVANQLEPWRELQIGLLEHLLQLIGGDVASVPHLVRAWLQVNVCLDKENIVD